MRPASAWVPGTFKASDFIDASHSLATRLVFSFLHAFKEGIAGPIAGGLCVESRHSTILFHERAQAHCHHQRPDPPLIDFNLSAV